MTPGHAGIIGNERANEARYIGRGMGLVTVPSCLLYSLVTNHNKFTISTLRFLS